MRKLDVYIGRTVAMAVGAVLLVLIGLDVIFAIVDQLGELEDNYQFADAVLYVLWTLPERIYEQLGFSALVGCMVGLGTLAGTSELTVMRAAGISIGRIAWAVMKPVMLLIVLGLALAEFVIPHTNQTAENRKAMALGELDDSGLEEGLWLKEGDEFVHFNAALPSGELYGVTRYRFGDERELQRVEFAERGYFAGDHWILENSRTTTFTADRALSEVKARQEWQAEISPELFALVVPLPSDLSPRNLWAYGNFLDRKGEDSSRYWLQFWKKLLQPLTIASLVMVAISFIFGPLREVTTGLRVFTGVIVGIVFQTLQDMLGPSSVVFGFPPFIAVLLPILLCFALGWLLLKRAR
ncbi:LPS export ABC transporter permease LptG [Microbulbifer thermotolerans]|uniref:LPS export ABC transporter permease LptG n=1 Tax=Microbulbifer thermotolerans TaxID=252514 RepID=A0A143HMU2_MICTH|nr:LPS export ABC transporter permease LptG [Microbulbifer thermotolerans]AMX03055.1 LPS export ABC transporter permease LptG [Microbulbifer thermotolerans]MCX2779021.1 LPS export ABC transporter permease LptG [Microbulbifer thermotolerans]MCX2784242.1 LPS export ABC transporter permease LptG [Microbulbifer thermotolerans]MCX2795707.1 LPS export ABC transporter permease LptG [Microbulbifer thermotolerans]MCX2802051.1 LPS export ABC transporter permease LptG [Microbulbifer thermotolerans]